MMSRMCCTFLSRPAGLFFGRLAVIVGFDGRIGIQHTRRAHFSAQQALIPLEVIVSGGRARLVSPRVQIYLLLQRVHNAPTMKANVCARDGRRSSQRADTRFDTGVKRCYQRHCTRYYSSEN